MVLSSTGSDPCCHRPCNNWATINFEHLAAVVQAVAVATTGLGDGSEWPEVYRLPE